MRREILTEEVHIDIPSLDDAPGVLTSGRLADVLASQRANTEFLGEREKAIRSQYETDRGQSNVIFDALTGRYNDPLKVLVYLRLETVPETLPLLRLVYIRDLQECCGQGWRVLDCAFNDGTKVEMAMTRTDWDYKPTTLSVRRTSAQTRLRWAR